MKPRNKEREQDIVNMLKEDKTFREIAEKYNLTKQRINQIAKRNGIYKQKMTKKLNKAIHEEVLASIKNCTPLEDIMNKHNISLTELEYRFNLTNTPKTLNRLQRDRRDKIIIQKFKDGMPVSQIIKLIKPLEILQPKKINTVHGVYAILSKYKVKRYPKIGNRHAGGTNLTKEIIKLIKNKRNEGLSYEGIANYLNEQNIRTVSDKLFTGKNLYMQRKLIGLA